MKILNHRLVHLDGMAVPYDPSPNHGGAMQPEYLVIHYTAGSTLEGSIAWFKNRDAKASAHLVIGRDGRVIQMVPFNRVAWHAGQSVWAGRSGLNAFSIGIELDNAGRLERAGSRWVSPVSKRSYADDDVLVAPHRNDRPGSPPSGWHEYTEAQMEATMKVAQLLMHHYRLAAILGHDDIAPGRKSDPGPAFPMASFRSRLLGRRDDAREIHAATTALNIRRGPGTEHAVLPGSPLAAGTRVAVNEKQAVWWHVDVLDAKSDELAEGWVHSRFLAPA